MKNLKKGSGNKTTLAYERNINIYYDYTNTRTNRRSKNVR